MRKNILILAHSYGMQFLESCNQYTRLYDREQYAVTVAYLIGKPDPEIIHKTLAEKVLFFNCHSSEIRGLKISAIRKLYKLCREQPFTSVICHRYKPTYIMLWVAQFCRIPSLICVMHAFGTMHSLPRRLLMRLLVRKNMLLAGVSDAVRDDIRRDLWGIAPKQIVTLYNIIDQDLFESQLLDRNKARKQLAIPATAFVFGNIGRLVPAKDQKTLIQAFALIKTLCPNAKIIIIGNGPLDTALKQQVVDLQLADSVIFTGFIPDSFRFIKAFDAFVLCSIEEAFGRVLLEAMIGRIPIIATRVDGIPEVIGDTGFLVPATDAHQLAALMQKIYWLPTAELHTLSDTGYQRMLKYFSLEPFKETFQQVCRGLL